MQALARPHYQGHVRSGMANLVMSFCSPGSTGSIVRCHVADTIKAWSNLVVYFSVRSMVKVDWDLLTEG